MNITLARLYAVVFLLLAAGPSLADWSVSRSGEGNVLSSPATLLREDGERQVTMSLGCTHDTAFLSVVGNGEDFPLFGLAPQRISIDYWPGFSADWRPFGLIVAAPGDGRMLNEGALKFMDEVRQLDRSSSETRMRLRMPEAEGGSAEIRFEGSGFHAQANDLASHPGMTECFEAARTRAADAEAAAARAAADRAIASSLEAVRGACQSNPGGAACAEPFRTRKGPDAELLAKAALEGLDLACQGGDPKGCTIAVQALTRSGGSPEHLLEIALRGCDLADAGLCKEAFDRIAKSDRSDSRLKVLALKGCDLGTAVMCMLYAGELEDETGKVASISRACDLGYAEACSMTAQALMEKGDLDAIDILKAGCKLGDAPSCNILEQPNLAELIPMFPEGRRNLKSCRDAGDRGACAAAGIFLWRAGAAPFTPEEAEMLRYLDIGCEDGLADSCQAAGGRLAYDERHPDPSIQAAMADRERSLVYFDKGCDLGDLVSCSKGFSFISIWQETSDWTARDGLEVDFLERGCKLGENVLCATAASSTMDEKISDDRKLYLAQIGCDRNDAMSCMVIAIILDDRQQPITPYVEKACRLGYEDACNLTKK